MRLIFDAEAFEKSVRTDFWEHYTDCHDTDQTNLLDLMMDNLAEQPTIEAKPVVHAHWNYDGEDDWSGMCSWFCSNCGSFIETEEDTLSYGYNFCPACGATMDEVTK
jgi:hypothetical protein